jgi:Flp pilus assembly protein TadB
VTPEAALVIAAGLSGAAVALAMEPPAGGGRLASILPLSRGGRPAGGSHSGGGRALPAEGRGRARRHGGGGAPRSSPAPRGGGRAAGAGSVRAAAVLAGVGVALVVGGPAGLVLGGVIGLAAATALERLEPLAARAARRRLDADLPVAADLVAAGVCAGAAVEDVAEAVADALGGPLGAALREVVATTRLGADPATAWTRLGATAPGQGTSSAALAAFGRAVARALDSGAPLGPALVGIAADQRARRRSAAEAAARRVGVRAVGPLALCFLPAFVLVGVVPVVASIVGSVLAPLR